MKLRTISRVIVVALVVVVGAVILLHSRFSSPGTALTAGTAFTQPAPAFQLIDQTGASISLAQWRGHVVVLTFVDAACTGECMGTAQALNAIARGLGKQAQDVVWLAVAVNPHNTPADATHFIAATTLTVPLHVLLGSQAELEPVWNAYHVEVTPSSSTVAFTPATYLIDQRGVERELLRQPIDTRATAQDLHTLLSAAS